MLFKHLKFTDKFRFVINSINIPSLIIVTIINLGFTLINFLSNMGMGYLLLILPSIYLFYATNSVIGNLKELSYYNFGLIMDEEIFSRSNVEKMIIFTSFTYRCVLPSNIDWYVYDLAYKREKVLKDLIGEE